MVTIFSVSLIVSLITNWIVLIRLGNPDFVTFFDLAWLLVRRTDDAFNRHGRLFLTSNLTVAFVLGVAFNAPLALFEWGILANFLDFSRGIISFSSVTFFVSLALAMLYLCSILIGRRHWAGSQNGSIKVVHYSARVISAIVIAYACTVFARNHDFVRIDATAEQLSSLSDGSIEILNEIDTLVEIDAFISPSDAMPEQYVQTRINLLTALREIDRESKKTQVSKSTLFPPKTTPPQQQKSTALKIKMGRNPPFRSRGRRFMPWQKDLYLGLVFKGNGGQQSIPFVFKGLPVEYEIMRTLKTVAGPKNKKKLGVFTTDAPL